MTRTAPRTASARPGDDGQVVLVADTVGRFTPRVAVGALVEPGQVIGTLEILGALEPVVSGAAVSGRATAVTGARHHRHPVDCGAPLVTLDPALGLATAAPTAAATAAVADGLVFRAPSSGRFYGRPSPSKPAFVAVGDVVSAGQTLCLLEVMKTFHRVTYGGSGLPATARIVAVTVADDADVGPGDPLFLLEPGAVEPGAVEQPDSLEPGETP